MLFILESNEVDSLELTFSCIREINGVKEEIEIIPNGKNILVTNANKKDYVKALVQWKLIG